MLQDRSRHRVTMNRGRSLISVELMKELLRLDKNVVITGAGFDSERNCVFLDFANFGDPVPEGAKNPEIDLPPIYRV